MAMYPGKVMFLRTHYGSLPAVSRRVGLGERHLRRILTVPGAAKTISPINKQNIDREWQRLQLSFLPEHLMNARADLTNLKADPGTPALLARIVEIEGMLADSYPKSAWFRAGNQYLLALASLARALQHKGNAVFGGPGSALRNAEKRLLDGRKIVAAALLDERREAEHQHLKALDQALHCNWMVAIAEQSKLGFRSEESVFQTLRQQDALGSLKGFLKENPCLWQAAVNGLELASRLKASDNDMLFFYTELLRLDPGFERFAYSPGEVVAIKDEPGLAYFRERFSHLDKDIKRRLT